MYTIVGYVCIYIYILSNFDLHCQSSKSHNTLRNFLCGKWMLHALNVWAYTYYQPFLQSVNATLPQKRRLLWPCGILCVKQPQTLLSNWQGTLINRRYFSVQTSRRFIYSFVQFGREYSAYWIPCLAAAIDHSHNLLAPANSYSGCKFTYLHRSSE